MIAALAGHRLARVTCLDCGTFSVRGGQRVIGIPAWLLTTDRGAQVLVDGGFPPAYAADAAAAASVDGLGSFGELIGYGPQYAVAAQLALCGVSLADLAAHVLTHGHIDHVGALPLITCPLVLTAVERADPRPRYFASARPPDWPDVPTLRIDGETRLCDGITLLPTPGHTPGHLSLLLELPGAAPILLAADAINRHSEPAEGFPDAEDPQTARASADRLLRLVSDRGARLVCGHEPADWPALPKAPAALAP
ncbi:MBL fold metallo-hydrolase [Rhodobacter sp. Har01]|uniref:MBL fold metallo-hydrolase n=1 Tax=Rhodobacter sp. Har01 TaxID=2883999 RepID=UPI001D05D0EE|nr:MBL fold metallo-hydrolase [Rhodobacter sp. Har01]MCB6179198.1 MBL fold metallo-hydrolase [Rhodobacter sp. Har01]